MKLEMYPLMELPFDAYCVLLDGYKDKLCKFIPSTMEEDLKLGDVKSIVYWYPRLVLHLYQLAYDAKDFREYLLELNSNNVYLFEGIFAETTKKLDLLKEKKLKYNHLNEVFIQNGKLR